MILDITVYPGMLNGSIHAPSSKSMAHRYLICAAFADGITRIICPDTSRDIEATVTCLRALGAVITYQDDTFTVTPAGTVPPEAVLNCDESGSTLRFLLPVVGALGVRGTFLLGGRLMDRPLDDLCQEMERMGCRIHRSNPNTLVCSGQLQSGSYHISGCVSSQFVSGLLFAMTLIPGKCSLTVTEPLQSKHYVDITLQALRSFGVDAGGLTIQENSKLITPEAVHVEGDWSNAAFFLGANALGSNITVQGLCSTTLQGDRAINDHLSALRDLCTIDAADIPDLVPVLSVVAAAIKGASFQNIARLRYKESDRVAAIVSMLKALGISASEAEDILTVSAGSFGQCTIDPCGDHRIAMSAAIAATVAGGPVTIQNAECVAKSYPRFWQDFHKLGGKYEQHIR